MDTPDDALVRANRAGDAEAFGVLVRRHAGPLLGYILHRVRDRELAEDLLQETFRRMHTGLDSFDVTRPFKPWLYAIARNQVIDSMRRRGLPVMSLDADESTPSDAIDPAPSPALALADVDRRALLRQAVESLPPGQRNVLELAYFHGMSYPQVAEVLGISVGTVKTHMSRAVHRLATILPPVEKEALK